MEPDEGVAPVLALIRGARRSIDLAIYELSDAGIVTALATAEERGVNVRVMLNRNFYHGINSFIPANPNENAFASLAAAGVPVRWAPGAFTYTHEKAMVVDGVTGFIMSFNLVQKYYPTGRDFGVIDRDPTDVAAMEAVFEGDWKGKSAPASVGDALVWSPGSRSALLDIIAAATSSLEIYNEEMADDGIEKALEADARRGVDVRIVMTDSPDWHEAFVSLAAAGAHVRTFPNKPSARYIHAKMILADGVRAFVGSENFSATSLDENRELGIVIQNPSVVDGLDRTFDGDWSAATPFLNG